MLKHNLRGLSTAGGEHAGGTPRRQGDRRPPDAIWLILAVAAALRLLGAWCANLIFDEQAHWALAQTIDFRPDRLHLVSRTLDHPLLSIYVLKLDSLLLGTSTFAVRIAYVLAGTATIVPVYLLAKRIFSEQAGLWAAALLAVDQFHVSWSRVFMPEVLMLLFASLALLQLLRTLQRDTTGSYVLLGALLGLTYLAKEPGILLIPAMWVYLLITPEHRRLLRRPQWYLAHGVFLLVVAPDLLWNLSRSTESYFLRDAALVTEPIRISWKSLSLYLGEVFRALIGADVLDAEYEQGNVYACHWPAGVLYLVATAAALPRRRTPAVRLLLTVFLVVVAVFTVMPGGTQFEPFWWASISLIPAVLCAGGLLAWASVRSKLLQVAGFLLLGYLGIHCAWAVCHGGPPRNRATVDEIAADFLRKADAALQRDDLREAEHRFIYVLNIAGPKAEAYYGLALVADRRGRPDGVKEMLRRCLELAPDHPRAVEWMERIEQPGTRAIQSIKPRPLVAPRGAN